MLERTLERTHSVPITLIRQPTTFQASQDCPKPVRLGLLGQGLGLLGLDRGAVKRPGASDAFPAPSRRTSGRCKDSRALAASAVDSGGDAAGRSSNGLQLKTAHVRTQPHAQYLVRRFYSAWKMHLDAHTSVACPHRLVRCHVCRGYISYSEGHLP